MTATSWAPTLPDHWRITTLRRVARVFAGGTPDRKNETFWSDGDIPWINSGAINQDTVTIPSAYVTKNALRNGATRWVKPKSVLIALAGQGKTKGMAARTEIKTTLNQSLAAIEPQPQANYRYLHYWLKSNYRNIRGLSGGDLRDGLNLDHIGSIEVPLPPEAEQERIADYLDHETAEIDAFIADQQDLSKLFQERWQSYLVHRIQTGGQSAAQLLSTEVAEWPHAPSDWEAMRLKSTIIDSQNGSWGSEPGLDSVTRRCIRVADFNKNSGRIHSANETERSYSLSQVKNLELQPGDLIIEKSGGGPTTPVGNVVLYDAPGGDMFSNFVARIRLRSNICPLFAVYLHRSLYLNQITQRSIKQTTGIQNLDAGSYFNETIFLPPLEEQKNIGLSIEENRIETEASLQVIEKTIDLARERRAALITAAVTGQIDVTAKNKPAAEQLEDDIAQGLHREHA